jgi:integrase
MVGKVIAWRDSRAATPRAADMGVQVQTELLAFGKLRTIVDRNVAAQVPRLYEGADRAEIIWTEEDEQRFAWSAIALNRPHVIDGLDLAAVTGMRRADLVAVTLDEVSDHAIVRTARKKSRGRRRRAVIPLILESRRLDRRAAHSAARHRRQHAAGQQPRSTLEPGGVHSSVQPGEGPCRHLAPGQLDAGRERPHEAPSRLPRDVRHQALQDEPDRRGDRKDRRMVARKCRPHPPHLC